MSPEDTSGPEPDFLLDPLDGNLGVLDRVM
jgi:hypothetical protein